MLSANFPTQSCIFISHFYSLYLHNVSVYLCAFGPTLYVYLEQGGVHINTMTWQ